MHNNENVVWQQERDDLWFEYFDHEVGDERRLRMMEDTSYSTSRFLADYDSDVSTTFQFYKLLKIGIGGCHTLSIGSKLEN